MVMMMPRFQLETVQPFEPSVRGGVGGRVRLVGSATDFHPIRSGFGLGWLCAYCKWYSFHGANGEAPVACIASAAQNLMTIHNLHTVDYHITAHGYWGLGSLVSSTNFPCFL